MLLGCRIILLANSIRREMHLPHLYYFDLTQRKLMQTLRHSVKDHFLRVSVQSVRTPLEAITMRKSSVLSHQTRLLQ